MKWRVEPICRVLDTEFGVKLSVSGYYEFKRRTQSDRSKRDEKLRVRILEIFEENYRCYGVRKVWHQLLREDVEVARCTVERLMKELNLKGAVRGKTKRTTIAGKRPITAKDLVRRDFYSSEPNQLWVADFTYIKTRSGWCYTAFVTDVFARNIIGWSCSPRMDKKLVSDAFRKAIYSRRREGYHEFDGVIHHNDKGSQYTSSEFSELLGFYGIKVSIGAVGDSYDNALAETINGAYKTELVKVRRWDGVEKLALETARWVSWYNTRRICDYNAWYTPCEVEEMWRLNGIDVRKRGQREGSGSSAIEVV